MDERLERAWAAGFFDGEGWAALEVQQGRRTGQPMAQINQADPDGVPEVLERFRRAVGCGQIYGPKKKEGRIDLYSWVASSRPNVARTFEVIAPWLGPVKTAQFATALSFEPSPHTHSPTSDELRAWAAGFWDGEGSIYRAPHRTHADYWNAEAALTQEAIKDEIAELQRFAAVVGVGRIYGPYEQSDANGPIYRWKAYRLVDIRSVIELLIPGIGTVKRQQIESVMKIIDAQPVLPRGNPAWGNRKTHCVKGHEYAKARLRPFKGRGKNEVEPRASKSCLACLREHAGRKRREKKLGGHEGPPSIGERRTRYLLK